MKVLKGKNEMLFLKNDSNQVIKEISGKYILNNHHVFRFATLLRMRQEFLNSQNIKYYYFVAPNKECVYSEYLPDEIRLSEERLIIKLISKLQNYNFKNIIYPLEVFIENKKKEKLYPPEDTHWNSFGAYIGFLELMKCIKKDFNINNIDEKDFSFYKKKVEGDLLNKIQEDGLFNNIAVAFNYNPITIESNNITNTGGKVITTNENKDLPTAVIFRDSFFSYMIPFIARSFSRCVILHQPNLDYKLIEEEDPDIVISQQVERFLVQLPDDIGGKSFEEYEKEKL